MSGASTTRPVVAVLIPASWRPRIHSVEAERNLAAVSRVRSPVGADITNGNLCDLLDQAVACITGWGTPPLGAALLASHPTIGLVAHTAGSIRKLVPASAMERGLRVSHAAAVIADAVAELVISQALLGLRQLHEIDRAMKQGGDWKDVHARSVGRLLGGQTVGVVGVGHVGRQVVRLFQAFGCRILVYDPTLTDDAASALGAERASLDDLLKWSTVVTLHAPVLLETRGMIGAAQLAQMPDGAVLINTARGALVDHEALLRALQSGRIFATLDVYDPEPLPPDHPIRKLPNVILSPHVAGHTADSHWRQGTAMVDEVQRFLRGEALHYEVNLADLSTIA